MDLLMRRGSRKGPALYLRWGQKRNRADTIAERLGLRLTVFRWSTKRPYLVVFRYPIQFLYTLLTLLATRPGVVFSQHTQPFCSLSALLYCELAGAKLVTDCHNGPFVDRPWTRRPLRWLNQLIYRRATLNLVHNSEIYAQILQDGWRGEFKVLHDAIPLRGTASGETRARRVFVMCSWSGDEPVRAIIAAARLLPTLPFVISGRPRETHAALLQALPGNVTISGYVSNTEYDALLAGSELAMALSTRTAVLMCACHEALAANVPLVTSDGLAARSYLEDAAVYTANSPEAIAASLSLALAQADRMRLEIPEVRRTRQADWERQARELNDLLEIDSDHAGVA